MITIEEAMAFIRQYPCSHGGCSVRGLEKCVWCKEQSRLLQLFYGSDKLKDELPKPETIWGAEH